MLSRELAAKSTVLLKNDRNLLPLKRPLEEDTTETTSLSVALIGLGASAAAYTAGTGSGGVQNSPQMVSAFVSLFWTIYIIFSF